jgi:hypothetical protein
VAGVIRGAPLPHPGRELVAQAFCSAGLAAVPRPLPDRSYLGAGSSGLQLAVIGVAIERVVGGLVSCRWPHAACAGPGCVSARLCSSTQLERSRNRLRAVVADSICAARRSC